MTHCTDPIIRDLEIMGRAVHYRDWIHSNIREAIGRRVLELGAGIGNFSELFLDRDLVIAVDSYRPAVEYIQRRYAGRGNFTAVKMDISSSDLLDLKRYEPDTVICLNVLEHVLDDGAALSNMHGLLAHGGKLALLVPSFQFLYGSIDRLVGHHRRYSRGDLQSKLVAAGFRIRSLHYMNFVAAPAWFINNRILNRREESPTQVLLFDRYVASWLKKLESIVHPPFGLSLVAIAEKA